MDRAPPAKNAEIDRNLTSFLDVLPSLVIDHEGEYALLRRGVVVDFFVSAIDAQIAGNQRYDDQMFSIQRVTETVEDLGCFVYALHSG